jgi:hypothetical protein
MKKISCFIFAAFMIRIREKKEAIEEQEKNIMLTKKKSLFCEWRECERFL